MFVGAVPASFPLGGFWVSDVSSGACASSGENAFTTTTFALA